MRRRSDGGPRIFTHCQFLAGAVCRRQTAGLWAGSTKINNTSLPGLTGVENLLWRGLGISQQEMNWRQYLLAILALNVLGLLVLFSMLTLSAMDAVVEQDQMTWTV